ncbi:MAG: hypothetical protein OEX02_04895 [Cyclobacteriaceae bacterium]|nr:hypothetical protein [Cyclobacteriaceae bacterium]
MANSRQFSVWLYLALLIPAISVGQNKLDTAIYLSGKNTLYEAGITFRPGKYEKIGFLVRKEALHYNRKIGTVVYFNYYSMNNFINYINPTKSYHYSFRRQYFYMGYLFNRRIIRFSEKPFSGIHLGIGPGLHLTRIIKEVVESGPGIMVELSARHTFKNKWYFGMSVPMMYIYDTATDTGFVLAANTSLPNFSVGYRLP